MPTGVDRYVRSLLAELASQQPGWQLQIGAFQGAGALPPSLAALPNVIRRRGLLPERVFRALVRRRVPLPYDVMAGLPPTDVVLFPDFVVWPLLRRTPVVAVVFDLSFLRHADAADARHATYLAQQVAHTVRKARTVVTISDTVRDEIVSRYGLPADTVQRVSPGLDHDLFRPRTAVEVQGVRDRLGLPRRYLLLSGTLEPRKNLVAATDAYDALPAGVRDDLALVLVGKVGWRSDAILAAVARARDHGQVVHLGFVDDADLAVVYAGAEVLLFPSLYEGFGLPLLEAMASGTPVVAADRPVLAEVAGGAALLVDVDDAQAFAEVLLRLLHDDEERDRLVQAGLRRAAEFTWSASARAFADVVRTTAG